MRLSCEREDFELAKRVIGPLSKPNVRRMLPIFQDFAKELSGTLDEAIEGEDKGVVEGTIRKPLHYYYFFKYIRLLEIVGSLFNRIAFKIISTTLLNRDISNFRSKSSPLTFEQCYKDILDPPALGKLITYINPFIPLRWLPIEANLAFIRANTSLRTMLAELIQERVQQVRLERSEKKEQDCQSGEMPEKKDFLTNLIEANLSEEKRVSEQTLIDTVRFLRNCQLRLIMCTKTID